MRKLIQYFDVSFGLKLVVQPLQKTELNNLPLFLSETYNWYKAIFAERTCVLAEIKKENTFSVLQIEKHLEILKTAFEFPVIFAFNQLDAYIRKRLIEKRIAFVVPEKQMYIPEFLIDLKEYGNKIKKEQSNLTPIAQLMLLYFILNKHNNKQLKAKSFKEIAQILNVKPMEISRAADNLKYLELAEISGEREKVINFSLEEKEIWQKAEQNGLLINPVIKKVFVDEIPNGISIIYCNTSALPEYTDINPSRQQYIAVEKSVFYQLQTNKELINENTYEGKYCIEVWKYNPLKLVDNLNNHNNVADPLSLYLSLKDNKDERIEMGLEQIIQKFIW